MLDVARTALERYHDVTVDDDGTLTFAHGGVVCAVQGTELDEGLPVLNLTCVVAWDLPADGRRADARRDGRRGGAVRHPAGDPRRARLGRHAPLRLPGRRAGGEGDGHAADAGGGQRVEHARRAHRATGRTDARRTG